jgi:hypothetical protein
VTDRRRVLQFRRVKIAALATVIVAALLAAGCGGSKQAAPAASTQAPPPAKTPGTTTAATPSVLRCQSAPASLLRRIETHVVLAGSKLSNAEVVPARVVPGTYFVSARVDGGGAKNMLVTWATEHLGTSGQVYAVDSGAALISSYVAAGQKNPDLSVSDPGAYKSRVCVAGPRASHGSDAPLSSKPASNG